MTPRIWTKPQTQAALRALRAAGFHETKTGNGYIVTNDTGLTVFRAMTGSRGYLVRHAEGLFAYAGETPVARHA